MELNSENINFYVKINNKKKIREITTKFNKSEGNDSNKQIKAMVNSMYDKMKDPLINFETYEISNNDAVVAYALVTHYKDSHLKILNYIYTEKDYRNFGLGQTLVKTLMAFCDQSEDCFMVELLKEDVFAKRGFYDKLGLSVTASGIMVNNITISNQENYDKLAKHSQYKIVKAA